MIKPVFIKQDSFLGFKICFSSAIVSFSKQTLIILRKKSSKKQEINKDFKN